MPLLWASNPSRSVSPSAMSAHAIRSFTLIATWGVSPSPFLNVVYPHSCRPRGAWRSCSRRSRRLQPLIP